MTKLYWHQFLGHLLRIVCKCQSTHIVAAKPHSDVSSHWYLLWMTEEAAAVAQ